MSPRKPSGLTAYRHEEPYANIRKPSASASLSHLTVTSAQGPLSASETSLAGWGSRHVDDKAPFHLWDPEKHDFRRPSSAELGWICSEFEAAAVNWMYTMFFVHTANPPNPVPLTIGGLGCRFVPVDYKIKDPIKARTNYTDPRLPDLVSWNLSKWTRPTRAQLNDIYEALSKLADVKAITILYPTMCIELEVNGRTYNKHSLPGTVAGIATVYQHAEEPMWPAGETQGRERSINPDSQGTDQHDINDYIASNGTIYSGVRLESSPVANDARYATLARSTSAGVLVRSTAEGVKMTASNHGFLESNKVYHPTNQGLKIGLITERWPAQDIALVTLDPSVQFDNSEYFEAKVPTRLLTSSEIENGSWIEVDGMSSGMIFLQARGVRIMAPPRPAGVKIEFSQWTESTIFYNHGPGNAAVDGISGAPLVTETTGGVAGFFHISDGEYTSVAVLDDFIARGWTLA